MWWLGNLKLVTHPQLFIRVKCKSKNENNEKRRSGDAFLSLQHFEGKGVCWGWGLERVISGSIIYTNLHKQNNKLVNAWLERFWCTNEAWAHTDS